MREPHRGQHEMATPGEFGRTIFTGFLLAMFLASAVAVVAAARTIEIGPKVGDILVFRQDARVPADWQVPATKIGTGATCLLRPNIMTEGGGSLLIEQLTNNPRQYQVHWAGRSTSNDSGDCGVTADVSLSRPDLQMLINAVGGVGVEHRTFAGF